jgi:4-aminobutyrate aminotransferase-like enzyme
MSHADFVYRGDKSRALAERDAHTLSPSYTRSYGFAISHGRGAEVWDLDGNRYIDFAAGIAVLSTGFSHPRIVKAIQSQAERYIHIGATDFFCLSLSSWLKNSNKLFLFIVQNRVINAFILLIRVPNRLKRLSNSRAIAKIAPI